MNRLRGRDGIPSYIPGYPDDIVEKRRENCNVTHIRYLMWDMLGGWRGEGQGPAADLTVLRNLVGWSS